VRKINGWSLLWYRSDKSLKLGRRRRTVINNFINEVCKDGCQFNGTVLVDPVWNSIDPDKKTNRHT